MTCLAPCRRQGHEGLSTLRVWTSPPPIHPDRQLRPDPIFKLPSDPRRRAVSIARPDDRCPAHMLIVPVLIIRRPPDPVAEVWREGRDVVVHLLGKVHLGRVCVCGVVLAWLGP